MCGWSRVAAPGLPPRPSSSWRSGSTRRGRTGSTSTCVPDDQDTEVERLEALGATRASIGQTGDEDWVVLADPEGNEFCVLSNR